ncbi:hypothetical protein ACTXT7_004679 [Hymenolepis weldensis]
MDENRGQSMRDVLPKIFKCLKERKYIRGLSHYIKVAEELSNRLNDSDMESQECVTVMSDAVKFKTKGSSLPARPKRPPSPAEAALKGQDTSSSSIPPSSSLTDTKSAEAGTSVKSGQVLNRSSNRGGGLLSTWFGCLSCSTITPREKNGNRLSSPRLLSSSHLPPHDRLPSASSESASSLSATESVSQPPVKTAFEYAFDRIEALKSISAVGNPQLLKLAENLQHYYFLLNNSKYKSAMQYIQNNFGDWIGVAKGVENAEISKSFRSELNEALTSAEKLKATLKASEQMSSIPEEEQSYLHKKQFPSKPTIHTKEFCSGAVPNCLGCGIGLESRLNHLATVFALNIVVNDPPLLVAVSYDSV